ncbi:YvbH-like oligomerisation region [Terribacillus halophilus]|uniref:YvbH-like oligomerisation region n=1 Tax=Terribacillus halophilus TaxID=361279 RepID=A0A1G6PCU8_9BACI|nr:PH domain-containing protein [Terribacillus halophilus]SDC78080.1 YvbH-like oligomerisation region [Terribacillus halophilus]
MFKKLASDALGLSDIGTIISPRDYDKTDADDYVMNEDNEKIYFLIKTKQDEYCFTNLAIIHVDGESAVSSKRTLRRYPYLQHRISNVYLETAGKVDLDIEIKFSIDNQVISIDVKKDQIDQLKDLYKALLRIAEINYENNLYTDMAHTSLDKAAAILQQSRYTDGTLDDTYRKLTEFGFEWLSSTKAKYHAHDFGSVYEKYINN